MLSPYPITYDKNNIAEHSSDRVEKDIVYIKTPNPCKQLYNFHAKAQKHAAQQGLKKTSRPARHGNKESIGNKNQNISQQIGEHGKCPELLPVSEEPPDLPEQLQVVAVFLSNLRPAVPLGNEEKINQKNNI